MSRTRTRGQLSATSQADKYSLFVNCSETSYTFAGSYFGLKTGTIESMTDTVTPGFRARQKRGEIIFNPMSKTYDNTQIFDPGLGGQIQSVSSFLCSGVTRRHNSKVEANMIAYLVRAHHGSTDGTIPPTSLYSGGDIDKLVAEAVTSVLSKRGRSNAQSLEDLAEMNKTLGILSQLSSNLSTLLSKRASLLERSKAVGNCYLMGRYGILPLVHDIGKIASELQKKLGTYRQTTRDTVSDSRSSYEVALSPIVELQQTSLGIQKTDIVKVRAMSLDEFDLTLADQLGLDFKSLVTLPWELIPYSFVVDWFLNIGDFIGSLAPSPGYRQLGSCFVVEREMTTTYTAIGTTVPSGTYTVVRPVSGNVYRYQKSKTRHSVGSGSIVIKNDFKLTNLVRAADAIALLLQKLR